MYLRPRLLEELLPRSALQKASLEVRQNNLAIAKAAKKHGVATMTLRQYLKQDTAYVRRGRGRPPKPNKRNKRKHLFEKASSKVLHNNMSLTAAAKTYGLPVASLYQYLKKNTSYVFKTKAERLNLHANRERAQEI